MREFRRTATGEEEMVGSQVESGEEAMAIGRSEGGNIRRRGRVSYRPFEDISLIFREPTQREVAVAPPPAGHLVTEAQLEEMAFEKQILCRPYVLLSSMPPI